MRLSSKTIRFFGTCVIVCVIGAVAAVRIFHAPKRYQSAREDYAQTTMDSRIHVTRPEPSSVISSPLTIRGEARGTWYFEASFPIELADDTGAIIARTHAEAESDWMTNDFVPFKAVLSFEKPDSRTGTLIFKKDNPSGLPQNEAEIKIPISF